MSHAMRRILFVLFFVSGFCGLLYQVIWTRMAFASFGIITPVLSVVISVFMLGLSGGAWAGGKFASSLKTRSRRSAMFFYALSEGIIGISAFAVPKLFALGERLLMPTGQTDSMPYLLASATVLVISILPWCFFMGTTFPLVMAYIREEGCGEHETFSFLYLANVLGAMAGTLLTAMVLIELFGFQKTLHIAAVGNFGIAAISFWLGRKRQEVGLDQREQIKANQTIAMDSPATAKDRKAEWILFWTGFVALAMEVIWSRAFTPVLKTQVYSFAGIVFTYLGATAVGSWLYRRALSEGRVRSNPQLVSLLIVTALLPVLANDPRFVVPESQIVHLPSSLLLLVSIFPFCALLGYLTPALIDQYAKGNPADTGRAYAINVIGCILGPLVASYVMLPFLNEKTALILLCAPFVVFHLLAFKSLSQGWRRFSALTAGAAVLLSLFFARDFEQLVRKQNPNAITRRDHVASVMSAGDGFHRQLLVNGIGMTSLTPITKFMVHLPLAFHEGKPESALIICFGMGTSYRSALSWDIQTTAVELVPSVKDAFEFYHSDAANVLKNPKGRIIIDDGRRFLKRTHDKFDVIVIDPPPPVEAAGSSLLYSAEFYELAKQRLKPNGILQAWYPECDPSTAKAILRSVCDAFPHVRCFVSVENLGAHMLASMEPIESLNAQELAARMPAAAGTDLLEWDRRLTVPGYLGYLLKREFHPSQLLSPANAVRITDDLPYNEYFFLRL
jgi:spermidine synthase